MNKYLMLTAAAAALCASATASAGNAVSSFTFANAKGKAFCDGGTVFTNGSSIWSWIHSNPDCQYPQSIGDGRVGRQGTFKGADMSDNWYARAGYSSVAINYLIPRTIKNKAKWEADIEFNGTTAFQLMSGVLLVGQAPRARATTSTLSAVTELLKRNRLRQD